MSRRHVAATKFCCGDKDFHKNSPVHTKRFVAATCRLTLLLQLVARPVHTEWSVAATCCSNLSPSVYRPLVQDWNHILYTIANLWFPAYLSTSSAAFWTICSLDTWTSKRAFHLNFSLWVCLSPDGLSTAFESLFTDINLFSIQRFET